MFNSNVEAQTNMLVVSPLIGIANYKENEPAKTKVTVKNTYNTDISIELGKEIVRLNNENKNFTKIDGNNNLLNLIDIPINTATLKSNERKDFEIIIKDPTNFYELLPSITVTAKESGTGQVAILAKINSVFILEDIASVAKVDVGTMIIDNNLTSTRFKLKTEVKNIGERIVRPAGVISVYKGQTKLQDIEITSIINSDLFPQSSVQFEKEIEIKGGNFIETSGEFTIKTVVNGLPYDQSSNDVEKIFIISPLLLLIFLISISFLLLIFFLTKKRISKKKISE